MTKRQKVLILFAGTNLSDADIAVEAGCCLSYVRIVRLRQKEPDIQTRCHRAKWAKDPDYRERRRAAWRRSSAKRYRTKQLVAQANV